ncbi:MAG: hypothetical protein KDJ44_02885 [Rhodoblastus sp.]|nr:hypothetical protein [Rhodoblastus sp.]
MHVAEQMDRALCRLWPRHHGIMAHGDPLTVDDRRGDLADRSPWEGQESLLSFVVIADDEMFDAGEAVEDGLDPFVAAEGEITEMPDGVIWLNARVPCRDHGFVHRCGVWERALCEVDDARVCKVGVGGEPGGHEAISQL